MQLLENGEPVFWEEGLVVAKICWRSIEFRGQMESKFGSKRSMKKSKTCIFLSLHILNRKYAKSFVAASFHLPSDGAGPEIQLFISFEVLFRFPRAIIETIEDGLLLVEHICGRELN